MHFHTEENELCDTCSIIQLFTSLKRCLQIGHAFKPFDLQGPQTMCPFRHWIIGGVTQSWHTGQSKCLINAS